MDPAAVAAGMINLVPFARTLGIAIIDVGVGGSSSAALDADFTADSIAGPVFAVAELPDAEPVHNHVGGPHAGAMFSLGETASGAVVLAAFGEHLHRVLPLAVRADIAYRKIAMGTVRARAELLRPVPDILAELDAGQRPEFPITVSVATVDGTITAEMTVVWTLKLHR